jgi:hypothetical protein
MCEIVKDISSSVLAHSITLTVVGSAKERPNIERRAYEGVTGTPKLGPELPATSSLSMQLKSVRKSAVEGSKG